jgi:outer membrane protein assembly factor BamB
MINVRSSYLIVVLLVVVVIAGGLHEFGLLPAVESSTNSSQNSFSQPYLYRLADISFGPTGAVENQLEELHEKVNDHWHQIWQTECKKGERTESACSGTGERIPDRVWNYWRKNPGNAPTGFNAIAVAVHAEDDSQAEADTVAATRNAFWSVSTGGAVSASPAVDNRGDTIYVASNDKKLYAIGASGEVAWSFTTEGPIKSSPAVGKEGRIYVGSQDRNLYAFDSTGEQIWSKQLDEWILASPALGTSGNIYVGTINGTFYSIDPNGTVNWSRSLDGKITTPAAMSSLDNAIYVGTWNGTFYKLNRNDGTTIWKFSADGAIKSSPSIDENGDLYFGSSDNHVYSVAADGTERWRFETGGSVRTTPVIGPDGYIYAGSWDHRIYKLNPSDGTELWNFQTGDAVRSTAFIGDNNRLYVGSRDSHFYSISLGGTGAWKMKTEGAITASMSSGDTDDRLPSLGYVGSNDGHVYAVTIGADEPAQSPWPKFQKTNLGSGSPVDGFGSIDVVSPSDGYDTNVSSISIHGVTEGADPGDPVSVSVNGMVQDTTNVTVGDTWSSDSIPLQAGSNTILVQLYESSSLNTVEDTASLGVNYDTQVTIYSNSITVSDGVDTRGYNQLAGDTFLRTGREFSLRVKVSSADTVIAYANGSGSRPTRSQSAIKLTNTAGTTWVGTIPDTQFVLGDEVSFGIFAVDNATNQFFDRRFGNGYRFLVARSSKLFVPVATPLGADSGLTRSAVSWADYNEDGKLDFVATGRDGTSRRFIVYRNDGSGTFFPAGQPFGPSAGMDQAAYAWGDYDADGTLDLAVTGNDGTRRLRLFQNSEGALLPSSQPMGTGVGVNQGSLDFGDYDNDGDLDLLVSGSQSGSTYRLLVLENNNGSFSTAAEPLGTNVGVWQSSAKWGDYDNDGDLDFAVLGYSEATSTQRFIIYRNDGGDFVKEAQPLGSSGGLENGSLAWGDYDADGDLDLVVSGNDDNFNKRLIVYENDGSGNFTKAAEPMGINSGLTEASVDWGDYDNDGDLDLIAMGESTGGKRLVVFRNNGDQSFTRVADPLGINQGISYGTVEWGDYNSDGRLDFVVSGDMNGIAETGGRRLIVFHNDGNFGPNSRPTAPNITSPTTGDTVLVGDTITFNWNPASDNETQQSALTYNLRVGTAPGTGNIVPADLDSDSVWRSHLGNVQHGNTAFLSSENRLDTGTYYWAVQAVDAGFQRSTWSSEQSFQVKAYDGPVWYVNDDSTNNDRFTAEAGSDTQGNGSSRDPFRSINYALNQADAGDTLMIDAGTYGETVVVSKNGMSLVGSDSGPNGTVLNIGDSTSATAARGIEATGVDNLTVRNLRVTNAYTGIELIGVTQSRVSGVALLTNGNHAVHLTSGSNYNIVRNSYALRNSGIGFFSDASDSIVFRNNVSERNQTGFSADNTPSNTVFENNLAVENTGTGYYLGLNASNAVLRNNVANGKGVGTFGYESSGSTDNVLFEGNIAKNYSSSGYRLASVNNSRFVGNVARLNTLHGFMFFQSSENNSVKGNNARNNGGAGFYFNTVTGITRVAHNLSSGNEKGFRITDGNVRMTQNEITDNAHSQILLGTGASADTANKNIIKPGSSDTLVVNNAGAINFDFRRNWFGSTSNNTISNQMRGSDSGSIIWGPFRLGPVDTSAGADTIAPEISQILSITSSTDTTELSWEEATTNGNGTMLNDFAEYRIYRSTSPTLSDWKDSATLVTTIGSKSTTSYTDNSVVNGDTYYYRVTVVDAPGEDGGDGVSDFENESYFSAPELVSTDYVPEVVRPSLNATDGVREINDFSVGGFLVQDSDNTISLTANRADTVSVYYTLDGTLASTADTKIIATNTTADTYEAVIQRSNLSAGDTVSFIVRALDADGDSDTADNAGLGYNYGVINSLDPDTSSLFVTDDVDTLYNRNNDLDGTLRLNPNDSHTVQLFAQGADTVTGYYRLDGTAATTSDTAFVLSKTASTGEGDTWTGTIPASAFVQGDTVNFVIGLQNQDLSPVVISNQASGYEYRVQPQFVSLTEPLGGNSGLEVGAIAAGDVTTDGDTDLVVLGHDGNDPRFIVFRNEGNGTFSAYTQPMGTSSGLANGDVALADITGNGVLDIVTSGTDGTNRRLIVWENNGDGSNFSNKSEPLSSGNGLSNSSVELAELDSDGYPELIASGTTDNDTTRLIVFQNDGSGNLSTQLDNPMGTNSGLTNGDIDVADIDGDGDQDFVATGSDSVGNPRLITFDNQGAGQFNLSGQPMGIDQGVTDNGSVEFVDPDQDGTMDLLVSGDDGTNRRLVLYANGGSGNFSLGLEPMGGNNGVAQGSVDFGPLTANGNPDLIVSGRDGVSRRLMVFVNHNSQYFSLADEPLGSNQGLSNSHVKVFDALNDRTKEIAVIGNDGSTLRFIILNNKHG